jgi:hypothetical protein
MKSIDNCLKAVSKAKTESFLGAIPSVFLVILSPAQSDEESRAVTQRLSKKSIIVLLEKKRILHFVQNDRAKDDDPQKTAFRITF